MTNQAIQQQVDNLAQEAVDQLRIAYAQRDAELNTQIEECERQIGLCHKRLLELA